MGSPLRKLRSKIEKQLTPEEQLRRDLPEDGPEVAAVRRHLGLARKALEPPQTRPFLVPRRKK